MSSILTHTLLHVLLFKLLCLVSLALIRMLSSFLCHCTIIDACDHCWRAWALFALFMTLFARRLVSGTWCWSPLSDSLTNWYTMISSVVRYLRCRTKSLYMSLESSTMSFNRSYKQDLQVTHLEKITNFMNQHQQGQESHCLCQIVISWTFSTEEWWYNSLLFIGNHKFCTVL